MADFTYMGTKKALASEIVEVCDFGSKGPLLELFSGLSAVGQATQGARPIWCNDVQKFSNLYCEVMFGLKSPGNKLVENWGLFQEKVEWHQARLTEIFGKYVRKEEQLLSADDASTYVEWWAGAFERMRKLRKHAAEQELNHLFTTTYALGYWSVKQAMHADSIRWAIDWMADEKKIDTPSRKLSILALCKALANASNSTGHFAQFLSPNERNIGRVRQKRRVDVFERFTEAMSEIVPFGTRAWRRKNRIFAQDAVGLARSLASEAVLPDVVYADPPYTDDQYSRYYHVLETVVLYDYPEISGAGRYRDWSAPPEWSTRFISPAVST